MPHTFPLLRKQRSVPKVLIVIEEYVPGLLLGLTALLLTADVIMRYIFNSPIRGAAEMAMLATVWLVYLAAAGISRRGAHIALDLVVSRFGPRGRAVFDIIAEVLTISVLAIVLVTGIEYLVNGHFVTLPATGISKAFVTVAIPVSALMMLVHSGIYLARAVLGLGDPAYRRFSEPVEVDELEDLETQDIRRIDRDLAGEWSSK